MPIERALELELLKHMLSLPGIINLPPRASQVSIVIKSLPANAGDTGDMGLIPYMGQLDQIVLTVLDSLSMYLKMQQV